MNRLIILTCIIATAVTAQIAEPDKRLRRANEAFEDIMQSPDKGIPHDLLDKARCVIIVPGLIKGAFGVGGKYGRGFAACRRGEGGWSSPASVAVEGGSFGLQLGGSSTDVIMLVMNQSGMNRLLGDKFTLGGEAAAAAGPVGRNASANTDALMRAEILSWSRSRGLFAGLSLEGATLRPDSGENRKLYGRDITNREILETGATAPRGAGPLIATLNRYSGGRVTSASMKESLGMRGGRLSLGEREVHFATAQSAVPAEAEGVLTDLANTLKSNSGWKLRVEGYTDNVGSKTSNLQLSRQRADSVVAWLEKHGVQHSRLRARGYGDAHPIADNDTEQGRARNRRVELVRD